ncbi:helix-turn-helix domain-containing protein [Mesorhizobium sp. LNHC229A00]|uniref:helix-turn-helix domain-containing protein n=1 Tax=Mesorhizobium sp. LNHC229A00 TaxID=1287240 RepID=UPI00041FBEBD|nr:helix-turn-helix domain-containing protein [Mesorhizobium sp. LNHC229A00]
MEVSIMEARKVTTHPDALVLTLQEAGLKLGFSKSAAYAAAARGDIPTVRIGGRIRVPKDALARLLQVSKQPA